MEDWQQRVIQEHDELKLKHIKLSEALDEPEFIMSIEKEDYDLLRRQEGAMSTYQRILKMRIMRFRV